MLPQVGFLGRRVSRLIIGDNPVNGHSYIPELVSQDELLDYYTEATIHSVMDEGLRLGYNSWMPLACDFMLRTLRHYRNQGKELGIIFQPYPAVDFAVNLRQMLEHKPLGIYHQGTTTDGLMEQGQAQLIKDRIKMIKDSGVCAGLGTHVPETILQAEEEGWGCDFYAGCLHNTRKRGDGKLSSFITGKPKHLKFFAEDRPLMLAAMRQVTKPCIAFKVLAGGQLFYHHEASELPAIIEEAFRETFSQLKDGDIAAVGCFQRDHNQLAINATAFMRAMAAINNAKAQK
jgi:hypothetical protein